MVRWRWIDAEVFRVGEPNPYLAEVPAVRRRLLAVPLDLNPIRTWLLSVNGGRAWHRVVDARREAVVGFVWVRCSTLRRRRLAWDLWSVGLLAATALTVATDVPGRPDPAPYFAIVLVVLALIALLLIATRMRAVFDPDDDRVGVRDGQT